MYTIDSTICKWRQLSNNSEEASKYKRLFRSVTIKKFETRVITSGVLGHSLSDIFLAMLVNCTYYISVEIFHLNMPFCS